MRKLDKLLKKVEALDNSKTIYDIEKEIKSINNNSLDAFGNPRSLNIQEIEKLKSLENAKEYLELEEKQARQKLKKAYKDDLERAFLKIMLENINIYYSKYGYKTTIDFMAKSENVNGYINYIKEAYNFNFDYMELLEGFFSAYSKIKKYYKNEIDAEKENKKLIQKRNRQGLVNSLYATAFITLIDKWANKRARRW